MRHERVQPFSEELASQCVQKRARPNGCVLTLHTQCDILLPYACTTPKYCSLTHSSPRASGPSMPKIKPAAHLRKHLCTRRTCTTSTARTLAFAKTMTVIALVRRYGACREEEEGQKRMTRRHRGRLEHSQIKGEFSVLDFKVRARSAPIRVNCFLLQARAQIAAAVQPGDLRTPQACPVVRWTGCIKGWNCDTNTVRGVCRMARCRDRTQTTSRSTRTRRGTPRCRSSSLLPCVPLRFSCVPR